MSMDFATVERARVAANMTPTAMCRLAGVPGYNYWRARKGLVQPSPRTLDAWMGAVSRKPRPRKAPRSAVDLVRSTYRGYLSFFAIRLGFDPERVVARAKARAFWRVRAMALNATSVQHDIGAAELGRAVGESKQIVHWNLRKAEDMRDDPKIDALMNEAARVIAGKDE